jgi:hypothetical protein
MDPTVMMQISAMMSTQVHGPVTTQSSVKNYNQNYNQQMAMQQNIHSQYVPTTPQQASHIQQTPHQASYVQQIPQKASYTQQLPIIPQQPNYTIYTSQVATASGAITPIAYPSATEESNTSDDDEDRLSWQEVRGRGKKRTSPKTTRAPTPKKNKPQETSNNSTQIITTHRFESLRHVETEGNTRQEGKYPALPPIFVPRITNMQQLTATIEQVVNRLNYTLKIMMQ